MDLGLTGVVFTETRLEQMLVLRSGRGDELQVEGEFRLTGPGGETRSIDPESFDGPADVVAPLAGEVTASDAAADGALHLTVGHATRLDVAADPRYEAWTLVRADGGRVVCMPGGELAIWDGGAGA